MASQAGPGEAQEAQGSSRTRFWRGLGFRELLGCGQYSGLPFGKKRSGMRCPSADQQHSEAF